METLILLWLVALSVFDLRRREVPDWLTLPVIGVMWYRLLMPDGWLPWALAGVTVLLTLAGVLPGGDMKGLAAMALFDARLYVLAWLGAGVVYVAWRIFRREQRMPGYVGFVVGGVVWWWLVT